MTKKNKEKKERAKWRILEEIRLLETRIEVDKTRIKLWQNLLESLEDE